MVTIETSVKENNYFILTFYKSVIDKNNNSVFVTGCIWVQILI